jgi:hypothetical protein
MYVSRMLGIVILSYVLQLLVTSIPQQFQRTHERTAWTIDDRIIGYATENKTEFKGIKNQLGHVIYTDRASALDTTKVVEGTMSLHKVASVPVPPGNSTMLCIAAMPCSCAPCRQTGNTACKFVALHNERLVGVTREGPRSDPVPNLIQLYRDRFAAIEEELRSRVLGFVLLSVSTDTLKGALKERNLPRSGRKFEMAARLLSFATAEQENRELLAIDGPGFLTSIPGLLILQRWQQQRWWKSKKKERIAPTRRSNEVVDSFFMISAEPEK